MLTATLRQYWVTVEGDDVADTGFQMVRRSQRSGSESVTNAYMALLMDDKVLIVKAQDDQSVTQYTGYLERMPSDVSSSQIVAEAEQEMPELEGAFLPYLCSTPTASVALAICCLGLVYRCLCCVSGAWCGRSSAATIPLFTRIMQALGRFGPTDYVAGQIDEELGAAHPNVGNLHLTSNWLVQAAPARLDATRLNDVIWAYKQVTQHRTNSIPTGKTYTAQIWDRHGVCISVARKRSL